jgi:hypothetical protein
VKKRILIAALVVGAFALTLALSRHDDLRRSDAAPSARVAAQDQPHEVIATPTGEAVPAVAALNPPPAMAPPPEPEQTEPQTEPQSEAQSEPNSTPDADRDRGTERSARAR